ncbi:sensor histidine kinase [Desulfurivibrio alkaliphilus]|uniref:histidine kinase n=1 Tax=Desulfurivibrio alkaliphilus (strain DSM 19089 / UNIQEM U267 / AHT2) TaxID=589865 RepID=D6Z6N5_DESAT|nr:sensor histidine kinase [Desulfurivibrio alkaliphilus]ADH84994.1 integral membrane sensor signal transduction histidine kinase [Desulfurivibrio alkaliphilus AHT 2]
MSLNRLLERLLPGSTESSVILAVAFCALAVLGLALLALLGWLAELPRLASFGPGMIPMAPSTALFFLLCGLALLVLLEPFSTFWRRLLLLPPLMVLVAFSLLVYFLAAKGVYMRVEHLGLDISGLLNGVPVGHMSPLTAFGFVWLGLVLALLLAARLWSRPAGVEARAFYGLILIFVVLIAGIITAGFVSFRHHEQGHRAAMVHELSAVAALKAERITAWLRELQLNGEELARNHGFADRVEKWLQHDDLQEREVVLSRLADQMEVYNFYGITLLAADKQYVYSQGLNWDRREEVKELLELAADTGWVVRSDLFKDDAGVVHMIWVVPIIADPRRPPVAFVIRSVMAGDFLFPFLAGWPGASQSAETLLVRPEGKQVRYLNPPRFASASPLELVLPLGREEVPAVQAVLGRQGIVEGVDYRGVPVVAALQPVPQTSWYLLARMDMAEMYAPLRERLWVIMLAVLVLLMVAAAGVVLLRRRQQHDQQLARLSREAQRQRHQKAELEQQVARRTAQLATVNRELEAFTYSVSHDLKAPLRGIEGYSRLLLRDYQEQLDEDGRLLVGYICRGVEQMQELIEALLAYSRLERREIKQQGVEPAGLVQAVLAGFADQLEAAGVELQVEVPECKVCADPEGLRMALRNLLANAIKFSRNSRPPRVSIRAVPQGGKLLLSVQDNGVGFKMKDAERIFEIFTRLARDHDEAGSGVGLALVRKAVERMGGRVWAESEPGCGATFWLEIPLAAAPHRDQTTAEHPMNAHDRSIMQGS